MLQVCGLTKTYNGRPAVDNVDLAIQRGETVVLMGPSGCGKSTLLRCLNRLTEPDCGEIWFEGQAVHRMAGAELLAYRRRVGFVFQHFNLIQRLSVVDNVALGLVIAGEERESALAKAEAALARVGLGPTVYRRRPVELSGGQRQRVGIARALAGEPDLMLWDEPTASLDPMLVEEVLEVMEDLARTARAGMLIVTHEMSFAVKAADRLLFMDQGKLVEEGRPEEVLASPRSAVGQRYRKLWQKRYSLAGHNQGWRRILGAGAEKGGRSPVAL
ncbi:MAG TPA: amino acid ABC transporter ATP-binding protein [Firmicutes bacterium]|nr:amino acid ABC transporter ATP-binding protein [Bacillota bacterium]